MFCSVFFSSFTNFQHRTQYWKFGERNLETKIMKHIFPVLKKVVQNSQSDDKSPVISKPYLQWPVWTEKAKIHTLKILEKFSDCESAPGRFTKSISTLKT